MGKSSRQIPEPVHQGTSKCGLKLIASDSGVTARDLRYHSSQPPMGATGYISGNHSSMGCVFEYDNPIADQNYQTNISFSLENWSSVQTLSANTNPGGTSEIKGLLYVPTLLRSDPCINITAPYIPHNVTRKTDFPSYQDAVPLVTVAPWVSID